MSNYPASKIVWIDCEMTGLNPDRDQLVEVAMIITDFDLKPLDAGFDTVIAADPQALANMSDFVRDMHNRSGLLAKIAAGVDCATAEKQLISYLKKHISDSKRPLVAGNTIGMDRRFIAKQMPSFDALLHYRSIDVSTIKELCRVWYPKVFAASPPKQGGHRALNDIAESIQELAYFKAAVFGNDTSFDPAQLAEISAETQERFAQFVKMR